MLVCNLKIKDRSWCTNDWDKHTPSETCMQIAHVQLTIYLCLIFELHIPIRNIEDLTDLQMHSGAIHLPAQRFAKCTIAKGL